VFKFLNCKAYIYEFTAIFNNIMLFIVAIPAKLDKVMAKNYFTSSITHILSFNYISNNYKLFAFLISTERGRE